MSYLAQSNGWINANLAVIIPLTTIMSLFWLSSLKLFSLLSSKPKGHGLWMWETRHTSVPFVFLSFSGKNKIVSDVAVSSGPARLRPLLSMCWRQIHIFRVTQKTISFGNYLNARKTPSISCQKIICKTPNRYKHEKNRNMLHLSVN